eukprot:TRINITY_DN3452_c0_g1_i1.p1 TRINITY_DN3452_c0_g1~~TRINITY_DN3452_c0_g1_i1.p1  ORF type:complete len:964 (+),score=-99.05 TRINITY_DN3452_c0_g1_i1:80-2971(+)
MFGLPSFQSRKNVSEEKPEDPYVDYLLEIWQFLHPHASEKGKKASGGAAYVMGLGTDVRYKQDVGDNPGTVTRGETLSFLSLFPAHFIDNEDLELTRNSGDLAHLAAKSSSVAVFNGPDTVGTSVGPCIARELLWILSQIVQGKTDIRLSGFSRGAAQQIIVTHELYRLKQAVAELVKSDQKTITIEEFTNILRATESVPTLGSYWLSYRYRSGVATELNNIAQSASLKEGEWESSLDLVKLDGLLQDAKIRLFLIDPVPGDPFSYAGVTVSSVAWNEPSLYTLEAEVGAGFVSPESLVILAANETSRCFNAVWPTGISVTVLPGCHGTADGNQGTDDSKPFPERYGKNPLSSVQDLAIIRRFESMSLPFFEKLVSGWSDFKTKHKVFDELQCCVGHIVSAVEENKSGTQLPTITEKEKMLRGMLGAIKISCYAKMLENIEAACFAEGSNYPGLGADVYLNPELAMRWVYFDGVKQPVHLLDPTARKPDDSFVNLEHLSLSLEKRFSLSEFSAATQLKGKLTWITTKIEEAYTPGSPEAQVYSQVANTKRPDRSIFAKLADYVLTKVVQQALEENSLKEVETCFINVRSLLKSKIRGEGNHKIAAENLKKKIEEVYLREIAGYKQAQESFLKEVLSRQAVPLEIAKASVNDESLLFRFAVDTFVEAYNKLLAFQSNWEVFRQQVEQLSPTKDVNNPSSLHWIDLTELETVISDHKVDDKNASASVFSELSDGMSLPKSYFVSTRTALIVRLNTLCFLGVKMKYLDLEALKNYRKEIKQGENSDLSVFTELDKLIKQLEEEVLRRPVDKEAQTESCICDEKVVPEANEEPMSKISSASCAESEGSSDSLVAGEVDISSKGDAVSQMQKAVSEYTKKEGKLTDVQSRYLLGKAEKAGRSFWSFKNNQQKVKDLLKALNSPNTTGEELAAIARRNTGFGFATTGKKYFAKPTVKNTEPDVLTTPKK